MIGALTTVKQGSDMCTGGLSQLIALQAMESGLLERILPRTIELYRARRDALCAALDKHLSALPASCQGTENVGNRAPRAVGLFVR